MLLQTLIIPIYQMAFEVISVMAVMTNCALIGMNPQVQKLLPSDMTAVNIVLIFVIVEVSLNFSLPSFNIMANLVH